MKKEYDFSKGKRGVVLKASRKKTRITIRLDDDVLQWFRTQVHKNRGGSYQTLINEALRSFVGSRSGDAEELLRRVLREELASHGVRKKR
jgi:uncharacterized protein (DUF4415 family)